MAVFLGALVVIVIVILIVGAFSYFVSEDGATTTSGQGVVDDEFADSFDRPADDSELDGSWTSERGGWGLELGVAYLPLPDPALTSRSSTPVPARSRSLRRSAEMGYAAWALATKTNRTTSR